MDDKEAKSRYARTLMELLHYPPEPEDPNERMLAIEEAIAASRKERGIDPEHEELLRIIWAGLEPTPRQD